MGKANENIDVNKDNKLNTGETNKKGITYKKGDVLEPRNYVVTKVDGSIVYVKREGFENDKTTPEFMYEHNVTPNYKIKK